MAVKSNLLCYSEEKKYFLLLIVEFFNIYSLDLCKKNYIY